MKKTVISVAIMVTVGTGLIFGTRAVTPQQKIEAAPAAVEQAAALPRVIRGRRTSLKTGRSCFT